MHIVRRAYGCGGVVTILDEGGGRCQRMRVVWFKRDLRMADHAPLVEAVESGEDVLFLYVHEPERCLQPDVSALHTAWEVANARALSRSLQRRGGTVQLRIGEPVAILSELHAEDALTHLHSHQETGLMWSWERDKRVAQWCEANDVTWNEHPSNGVVRGLVDRDRWNGLRNRRMTAMCFAAPESVEPHPRFVSIDETTEVVPDYRELVQTPLEAGERAAHGWLDSFVEGRWVDYLATISNPATSPEASSRLSAYIASGVLSVRQVKQRLLKAMHEAHGQSSVNMADFRKNINAFTSRVSWRCHFVQRLEMETTMNVQSINPELDEALGRTDAEERFRAWAEGTTGWPFFDACMRSLKATGWINFRMRAMMQSVAAYTLWLPWQRTGNHLAQLFIDYEPGIHWSQIHMQSGVTGINAVRAYSILKQSLDHDETGDFIRKWVPELSMVPTPYIHEPWTMSKSMQETTGTVIGVHYPRPIVDENEARSLGIKSAYAARKHEDVKARSAQVYARHGSRKQRRQRRPSRAPRTSKPEPDPQTSLLDFQAVPAGPLNDKGGLKG